MNSKVSVIITLAFASLIFGSDAHSQGSTILWSAFDMGYGASASSQTVIKSVIGQAFVGDIQQVNTRIESGFLAHPLFRGLVTSVGEKESAEEIPSSYELRQNYPNPFNPITTIAFALPKPSTVTLKLFDIFGREVETIFEGKLPAGKHQVIFDAGAFSSGTYFYRLQTDDFSQTKRLMLVK